MSFQIKEEKSSRPNKRRLASKEEVIHDLEEVIDLLFLAHENAKKFYFDEIVKTPPQSRGRGFEASLMNSKMIQCVQELFPGQWSFGKHKRFILRVNGYNILFKKFDMDNKPMNIKTNAVLDISHQLSIPFAIEDGKADDPIIFFGYKKNSIGKFSEPLLVYLDEGKVKWVIRESDFGTENPLGISKPITDPVQPTVREGLADRKKTAN